MLLCTVRGCHLPLTKQERRLRCASNHSFDIARSGYVNLLQPQDKRSKQPGDSAEAVGARLRLHDLGVTEPLLRGITDIARPAAEDLLLDVGCGTGYYTANFACHAHGIDISIPAIDAAARAYPGVEWIVGNADRFVPYADASFSLVTSITARMNVPEFRRIIREDGRLLIALPSPEDLVELRGHGKDRTARTIEEFSPSFELSDQARVTTTADLDAQAVESVLHAIYRPMQQQASVAGRVTFSLDLLLFRPRL